MTRRKAPSPAADLHRAVDLFYQAAADPAAWGEAFAVAARALAAPASCATWIDGAGPDGA